MNKFLLDIITPTRKAYSQEVDSVSVPSAMGRIEILAKHEALFSLLEEGEVEIKEGGKTYFLAIGGGFMEVVHGGTVTILVSRAVHAHELNEAEIQKALDQAKTLVARKATGDELARALALMQRSRLELKIARKRRNTPLIPI